MRSGLLGFALALALFARAPALFAQAAPAPVEPAATGADTSDDDGDDADEPPPKKKKSVGEADAKNVPAEPEKEGARLPPPGDPRADEQEPRPYLVRVRPLGRERHLEFGPDVGVWSRPAKGDSVEYEPSLAWGVHARVELWRYLGFMAYFNRADHAVSVPRGSLGLDFEMHQEPLHVLQIGARLEPTIEPVPNLRLWLGLGVAWGHISAEEPETNDEMQYATRAGVFLEYSAALGASWEVIPRWLALSLSGSAGMLTAQSGDLYTDHQVIAKDGTTTTMNGLPELAGSYSALIGVGIVL